MSKTGPAPRGLRLIVLETAREHGFEAAELTGRGRSRHLSYARWHGYRKAREAGYSLAQIGFAFDKDHTSVRHGLQRLAELEATGEL